MDVISYTVYTASLCIDGVYKEFRSQERQAVADWLMDIMQRAGAAGLPITRPKVMPVTLTIRKGIDWSSYRHRKKQLHYSSASSDPAILDWHPEWSKE